ncbi:MAG: acyl-CoA dehydrogenase N-terminal domain-containing protein, partial [Hyphomicrobium sp.]
MNSYSAPLRDIRFVLFDVLGAEALYQRLGMAHAQRDLLDAVLDEAAKFTETVLAPLNVVGDEHGCVYDKNTGAVATPAGFKEAYAQFGAAGWTGLTAPE